MNRKVLLFNNCFAVGKIKAVKPSQTILQQLRILHNTGATETFVAFSKVELRNDVFYSAIFSKTKKSNSHTIR